MALPSPSRQITERQAVADRTAGDLQPVVRRRPLQCGIEAAPDGDGLLDDDRVFGKARGEARAETVGGERPCRDGRERLGRSDGSGAARNPELVGKPLERVDGILVDVAEPVDRAAGRSETARFAGIGEEGDWVRGADEDDRIQMRKPCKRRLHGVGDPANRNPPAAAFDAAVRRLGRDLDARQCRRDPRCRGKSVGA
jgi:hypothetical protein